MGLVSEGDATNVGFPCTILLAHKSVPTIKRIMYRIHLAIDSPLGCFINPMKQKVRLLILAYEF